MTSEAFQSHTFSSSSSREFSQVPPVDDIARIFNTAVVSTRTQEGRDCSAELYELVRSPAYQAILAAVKRHSSEVGVTEVQAAEQIIQTFRKLDQIWGSYLYQEGVARLRSQNMSV
jgi:hypothetical protein